MKSLDDMAKKKREREREREKESGRKKYPNTIDDLKKIRANKCQCKDDERFE
jgi:hypothetical protein